MNRIRHHRKGKPPALMVLDETGQQMRFVTVLSLKINHLDSLCM
jgi:hypothetical protein